MFKVRKSTERGHFDHGWLDTYHTFSFDEYYDPEYSGFRTLRVINEDRVAPGEGFPTHGHRDMEIITYVLEGELAHKDSMGTGSVILPGDVQKISAGKGITHSEFNSSKTKPLHLLQIWILPNRNGIKPGYEQKTFSRQEMHNKFKLVGSNDGKDGSITIHQDVSLFAIILDRKKTLQYSIPTNRHIWLQIARGSIEINDGTLLSAGDGASVSKEDFLKLTAEQDSEFLLFDLG